MKGLPALARTLAAAAVLAGCSVTATTTVTDDCTADSTVTCAANSTGYSCTGSATPQSTNSALDCGAGVADGAETAYCCITLGQSTCTANSSVSGCGAGSYGFSCTGSDTPAQANSALNCSTGTVSGSDTLYCCSTTTTPSSTCTANTSVSCTNGAQGWSCTGADTPSQDQSGLECSAGTAVTGATEYCCIAYTSSGCSQDSSVTGCQAGSYGFSCTGTNTPQATDSALTCSTGTAGSNGETLYCCSN